MSMAISAAVACAVLALIFKGAFLREQEANLSDPNVVIERLPERPSQRSSGPAVPAHAEPAVAQGSQGHDDERASLSKAWNGATNLRAFALDARRQPSLGGRLYAEHIARLCSSARYQFDLGQLPYSANHAAGSKDQLASSSAARTLQEQCSPFTSDELDGLRLRTTDPADDPLVRAYRTFDNESKASPDRRRALMKEVLDARDPVLLEELGVRLALHTNREQGLGIYFDGNWYPIKTDPDIAAAFALLPCEFGYPCGATNVELLVECVLGNPCYASRWQKLEREQCAIDAGRCQRVAAWTRRLADAVRTGRDDLFTPPP